ncbi:MAG: hypothetical protein HQK86_13970 [Nitrospinae bacterium]|nr:hypothetical protein [Nitrospinota bacterium]
MNIEDFKIKHGITDADVATARQEMIHAALEAEAPIFHTSYEVRRGALVIELHTDLPEKRIRELTARVKEKLGTCFMGVKKGKIKVVFAREEI